MGSGDTEFGEFLRISPTGFCRVVGDEDEAFVLGTEVGEGLFDVWEESVTAPDYTRVNGVEGDVPSQSRRKVSYFERNEV